jgi:hypothetical protein
MTANERRAEKYTNALAPKNLIAAAKPPKSAS